MPVGVMRFSYLKPMLLRELVAWLCYAQSPLRVYNRLMMRHMFIVALFFLTEVTVFLFHIYGWKNFELSQPILDNARTHPQMLIKTDFCKCS